MTAKDVHMLAHAARMQLVLERSHDHHRAEQYSEKMTEYKACWNELPQADRDEIADTIKTATRPDGSGAVVRVYDGIPVEIVDITIAILEG